MLASGSMTVLQDNVRREMDVRGWSRSDLARECRWAPARVTEFFKGEGDPRLSTLDKLAAAFGMDTPAPLLIPSQAAVEKSPALRKSA